MCRNGPRALPVADKGSHARLAVDTCPGQHDHRTLDPRSPPCRKSPHASPPSARGPVANQKRREVAGRWSKHKSVGSRRSVLGRLETGDCASDEPGASSPVGAGAGTRKHKAVPRSSFEQSTSRPSIASPTHAGPRRRGSARLLVGEGRRPAATGTDARLTRITAATPDRATARYLP
jgi:hypothetical protein